MSVEDLTLEGDMAKEKLLNKMRAEGISEKDMNFVDKKFGKIMTITNLSTSTLLELLQKIINKVAEREGVYMANQVAGGTVVNFIGSFLRSTYRDNLDGGDEMVMLLGACIEQEKVLKGKDNIGLKPIVRNPSFKGIDERKEFSYDIPDDWKESQTFMNIKEEKKNV